MTVYTYGHEYLISSVQGTNDKFDIYLSKDRTNGGFFRLLCVKDRTLYPGIVSFLAEKADPEVFTDYIENFIFDDNLYVVMRYTQGTTLKDKLDTESISLIERLELCRRILERAVLLSVPDYFIEKSFNFENIIVENDFTVSFNYPIEDIAVNQDSAPIAAAEGLLRAVFAGELERKVPSELMEFFDGLPELYGADMIELYDRYYSMLTAITEKGAEDEEPKSFWYLAWEKIKVFLSKLRAVLMFLLLAAAIIYMVFTIYTSRSSNTPSDNFDSIGTVNIDKGR